VHVSVHIGEPVDTGLAVGVGDSDALPLPPVDVAVTIG
jgi:hypothetical protein